MLRRYGRASVSIALLGLNLSAQPSIHQRPQRKQPLSIIENRGLRPTGESRSAEAGPLRVFVRKTAFVLRNSTEPTSREQVIGLVGSGADMKIEGLDPLPAKFNFFIRSSELRLVWTAIR